jgi:hypothetical protein
MEQVRKGAFDWSKHPSVSGRMVFIANPNEFATFGDDTSKEEFVHMLRRHNIEKEFDFKKQFLKYWALVIAGVLPWAFLIIRALFDAYNVFKS